MTDLKPNDTSLSIVRRIAASPEQLYEAWTQPARMVRWFAPAPYRVLAAEADARVGGRYRIVVASAGQEHVTTGEYVELVPHRRIVTTWRYQGPLPEFGDEPTLVTVDLRPLAARITELTLSHVRLASEAARRSTFEGWQLCLDALEHAEGPKHQFTTVRRVNASVDRAYAAWTEPELMRRWFGTVVEADVRVGGRYRVENHEPDGQIFKHKGEYLVLEPGRRIVKTFEFDGEGFPDYVDEYSDEIVTVSFRSLGPKLTEVTLTNRWNGKAMSEEEMTRLDEGWGDWLNRYERALPSGNE